MQTVTTQWLLERGGLHDARVGGVRQSGSVIEIELDDAWANERGLALPEGDAAPGTLIISHMDSRRDDLGAFQGGWISEVELDTHQIRLAFCDRDLLVLSVSSVMWAAAV